MFRRLWQARSRGAFLSFLLSYLIILVIPIVLIGGVIYGRILRQLEAEVRLFNQVMLRQAVQVMDLRLQELGSLAGQISLNPRVRDFLFRPGTGPEEILKTMDLCKEMGIFQAPNRFLADLIVYSHKADAIVSRQSRYTPSFYYENVARPSGQPYQAWLDQLRREHLGTIAAGDFLGPDGLDRRYLTYMQSVPAGWGQAGTMVAYIDGTQITQLFAPLVAERQGVALIADRDGQVLISTGRVPAGNWAFPAQAGFFRRTLDGRKMVIYYERSPISGWSYVSIVPANIFNAKVSAVRLLIFAVLVLCLLMGFAMAAVLSWRNYRPIQAVLDVLRPLRPRGSDAHNEWAVIMESAQEMVCENRRLQSFLAQNEAQVRSNLLRRLLYGRVPAGERAEMLRMLRCQPGMRYAVLAVDIEVPPGQTGDSAKNLMSLAAAEGIEGLTQGLVTEVEEGRLGVLAALGEGQNGEAAVLGIAREIQAGLDREYKIPVSIGFSIAAAPEMVPQAFRQASQAADYRIVSGRCTITPFSAVARSDKSKSYYYPLDWERQIVNQVKAGDFAAVSAMVDEVYAANFVRRHLPLSLVRCMFYDLMGTALKVLYELNIDEREILGDELAVEHCLARVETTAEMRENLKRIYGRLCAWIAGKRESHNTRLKEDMLAILAQEYADPGLGLAQLAERVKVSASYLCRFFKDQTGYNFADYLNRLRMDHAKRMLREGSATVGEIALSVGYLSANTFIRVFKKYEGVTPGQFRGRYGQTAV